MGKAPLLDAAAQNGVNSSTLSVTTAETSLVLQGKDTQFFWGAIKVEGQTDTCHSAYLDDTKDFFVTRKHGCIQNLHVAPWKGAWLRPPATRNEMKEVSKGKVRGRCEATLTSPHPTRFPETLNSAGMARDKYMVGRFLDQHHHSIGPQDEHAVRGDIVLICN